MESRVLLIGGPPGAGKTSVGRAVAGQLGYGSLTVDDLVIAGRALTTDATHPALHPMRGRGHTRYFTETAVEQLIADAVALEEAMWPAITRVVRSHVHAGSPTTIDWWLLSPARVHQLADAAVTSVWLYVAPEVLEARERRNEEFLAGSSDPEGMFSHFMARSLWRNQLVAVQAQKLGLPLLRQSGGETVEDLAAAVLELIAGREG